MESASNVTHPWCHPDCHYLLLCISSHHCDGSRNVTTFLLALCCMGTIHPRLLTSRFRAHQALVLRRFSLAGRSRRRSGRTAPFRTSTLFRLAVGRHIPHSVRSTRISLLYICDLRIPADWQKVK